MPMGFKKLSSVDLGMAAYTATAIGIPMLFNYGLAKLEKKHEEKLKMEGKNNETAEKPKPPSTYRRTSVG